MGAGKDVAFSCLYVFQRLSPIQGFNYVDFFSYFSSKELMIIRVNADVISLFVNIVIRHPVRVDAHVDVRELIQVVDFIAIQG